MIVLDTNLQAKSATAQYTNFDFDSMVRHAGKTFAVNDSGLFEISADYDDDNGTDIVAYFEPVTTDFGISNEKRLRAIYLGYEAAGNLTMIISTEMGTSETLIIPAHTTGQKTRRVTVSRSVHGRWFTFQIYSNGVDFAIDELRALVVARGHNVNNS